MNGALFLVSIVAFVITELVLSRAIRGNKNDSSDRGTFWLVWLTWNFAIVSNLVVFALISADPQLWFVNLLGAALCLSAAGLRLLSKRTLGRFYTMTVNIQEDHRLIQAGPYRFVRHPLYAGFALFFLAWPLTQPSLQGIMIAELLGGLPVLTTILIRLRVEEQTLASHFSAEWSAYAERTSRLIPWVF
jgi:protein-S-isoprenylcysteine O-methyltransferase